MPFSSASLLACLLLVPVLLLGRSGCTSSANNPETAADAAGPPPDFAMVIGKGGGFAGLWQGYTIRADGTVERWQGNGVSRDAQPVGTLTPAQRDSLWRQIHILDFFMLDSQGTGNMTGTIEVTANDTTHTVRWPVSLEQGDAEPPYEQLYTYVQILAEAAR